MEPQCYAYALNLVLNQGDDYDNKCYGRGFGAPEVMQPRENVVSGVKLCQSLITDKCYYYTSAMIAKL